MPYKILSIVDKPPINTGTPYWALDLIEQVKQSAGMSDRALTLVWHTAKDRRTKEIRKWSSGFTYWKKGVKPHTSEKITINAGYDTTDQKCVLLHELAHWIINETHTDNFWIVAYHLFMLYMPDNFNFCHERSMIYKKRAIIGYNAVYPEWAQRFEHNQKAAMKGQS